MSHSQSYTTATQVARPQSYAHQSIQELCYWIRQNSITQNGTPPLSSDLDEAAFLPYHALRDHLKANSYKVLNKVLGAFWGSEGRPPAEAIAGTYDRVFCILLQMKRLEFLPHFIRHYNLSDKYLPFGTRPQHFPDPDDSELFGTFCSHQWPYCAPDITYNTSRIFEDEIILPIISKVLLKTSSSAILHKIKLHPTYNQLRPRGDSTEAPQYLVLKTYIGSDAETNCEKEVAAYHTLQSSPFITVFYGAFRYRNGYHILLEYTDKGTLEDFLLNNDPPQDGDDIIELWNSIFGVVKGLQDLHNRSGWHQDVKPANILVFSATGETPSPHKYIFKLVDFGNSHFEDQYTGVDTQGTKTYGAPECYRSQNVFRQGQIKITRKVDVWSAGCILSEVAVWMVLGRDQLLAYRKERRDEAATKAGLHDGDCFHDGENVLKVVKQKHDSLTGKFRENDKITREVLVLIKYMLMPAESRSDSQQTCARFHIIYNDAIADLQEFIQLQSRSQTNQQAGKGRRNTNPPSQLPPDVDRYAPDRLRSATTPHPMFDSNGPQQRETVDRRTLSYKHQRDSSPKIFESPIDGSFGTFHSNTLQQSPFASMSSFNSHQNQFDSPLATYPKGDNAHLYHSTLPTRPQLRSSHKSIKSSPELEGQRDHEFANAQVSARLHNSQPPPPTRRIMSDNDSQFRHASLRGLEDALWQPTQPPLNMISDQIPQRNTITLQQLEGEIASSRGLGLETSAPLNRISDDPFVAEPVSISSPPVSTSQVSSRPAQPPSPSAQIPPLQQNLGASQVAKPFKRPSTALPFELPSPSNDDNQPARRTISPDIPPLTIVQAQEWRREKKKYELRHPFTPKGSGAPQLPNSWGLDNLAGRDHVFVVDDAESMRANWDELVQLFSILAYMVKERDEDGLDLYFIRSEKHLCSKHTSSLVQCVKDMKSKLDGLSSPIIRLDTILKDYVRRLRGEQSIPQLSIYFFTNGVWTPQCDLVPVIDSAVKALKSRNFLETQIGIQFISFGNDPNGLKRLDLLDNHLVNKDLDLDFDIVDTTESNGNPYKMLRGAIDRYFDSSDNKSPVAQHPASLRQN